MCYIFCKARSHNYLVWHIYRLEDCPDLINVWTEGILKQSISSWQNLVWQRIYYSSFKLFQPIIIILTYFVAFVLNFLNTKFSVSSSLLELFFSKLKSLYYAYFLPYTSLITVGKSLYNMVLVFLSLSSETSPFTDYKNGLILWPFFHCDVHSSSLTLPLAAFYCSLTDRFLCIVYTTFSLWPYVRSLKT